MSTQDEGATMTAWTSRLQPSRNHLGVVAGPSATHRAVAPKRALFAFAFACLALGVLLHQGLGSPSRRAASGVGSHAASRAGLSSLPIAAQGPVSAALGSDQAAYRFDGLVAHNPAQRLSARFGRSGVAVTAGSAQFAISLQAFGRGDALHPLAPVSPVASAGRVSYARGSLRESWANGPLGLEQSFDLARRPAGAGALTLSLSVPASARLAHGTVLLPGGLRYAGVHATDAAGRALPARLQLHGGRVLVRVDDRGARYPVRIDPFVQQAELTAGDGVGGDEFGYSVAVSGNTVVVGAPEHEVGSNKQQGAVYVFEMGAGGWADATQTAELTDSTGEAGDELGYAVAISGNTIAAGEPAGSEILHDSNPRSESQGTVDVFTTTGSWASTSTPNSRLTESAVTDVLGGELGWSVAISGKTIVAGAPFDGIHGDPEGVAFVFVEPGGGWSGAHTQTAELTESDPSGADHFGTSVAVSGNTVAVGALFFVGGGHQGAAFVFTEPVGGWKDMTQNAELGASSPNLAGGDELGASVAVSGNTVVAGAFNHKVGQESGQGTAYVFAMPGGGWKDMTQTAELTSSEPLEGNALGFSVAISGNTIVAGAPSHQVCGNDDQGMVYTYTMPAGGWANMAQTSELIASDGTPSDNLGYSVAIAGSTIVSGAYRHVAGSDTADHGAAEVFTNGGVPAKTSCETPPGGSTPPVTGSTPPVTGSTSPAPGPTGPPAHTATPVAPPTAQAGAISGGPAKITVTLSCPAGGAGCAPVSLQATVKEHLKGTKITAITAGAKKNARVTTRQVVVASGGVTLAAGATQTLTLKLNTAGQALLSKFSKLPAIVTLNSAGKTIGTATVTAQKTKPKKKKK
jgi:hypothetical protein